MARTDEQRSEPDDGSGDAGSSGDGSSGSAGAGSSSSDDATGTSDSADAGSSGLGDAGSSSSADAGSSGASGQGIWAEVRDAVSPRSFLLVVATLGLGLGFVLSYVGALHNPQLQNLPVTVASSSAAATKQVVSQLSSAVPPGMIVPTAGTSVAAATQQVKDRQTGGAFIPDLTGTQDTLIVASAAGSAQATALEKLFTSLDEKQNRTLKVDDVVPAGSQDFDGLSAFYLVVGWCVTGYLIASILGISAGSRPANLTRAVVRLLAIALAGFVAAIVGTWLVQQHVLGALSGRFWPMVATGTLLIVGVGAVTMGLQIAFGVVGIGLAVLLVVVLGNPSAGGAFPRSMLPTFWRSIGAFLPPGAGTDAVRSISYFDGAQTGYPMLIMGGYVLVGLVLALVLCALKPPSKATGKGKHS